MNIQSKELQLTTPLPALAVPPQADQHPAEITAKGPIVKQRNVPANSHVSKEAGQCAGAFRKPETAVEVVAGSKSTS